LTYSSGGLLVPGRFNQVGDANKEHTITESSIFFLISFWKTRNSKIRGEKRRKNLCFRFKKLE
jgi:hypothetical protein